MFIFSSLSHICLSSAFYDGGKKMEIYLWAERLCEKINAILWGPIFSIPMLCIGIWFTVRLGFFQFRGIKMWIGETAGKGFKERKRNKNGISPYKTLTTALAGTMGTGNIVGVASAIAIGGAGSVFWMWVSALFCMMTKYAETVLAVKFRKKNRKGEWEGGAMEYMEYGLGSKRMAVVFGILCVFASFGMGNMTQANSIACALNETFAIPPILTGCIMAALLLFIICGGIKRISSFAEKLIPILSILYILGGLYVILTHHDRILPSLREIFRQALLPSSAIGGTAGYGIGRAMRYGFSRGIFSNEAGLGSSGMVYASADDADPVTQGMWGMFEVFADTIVVCTVTALAILTGIGYPEANMSGTALTIAAFSSSFGSVGRVIISLSITLFAFASIVGWAYYGERGMKKAAGEGAGKIYKIIFVMCAILGSVLRLELVWGLSEVFNALMAIPNLTAVILLSKYVFEESERICRFRKDTGGKCRK